MIKANLPLLGVVVLTGLSGCFASSGAEMAQIEAQTARRGGETAREWLVRAPICAPVDQLNPDEREGFLTPTYIPPNIDLTSPDGTCSNRIPNEDYTLVGADGSQTVVRFVDPPLPPVSLYECQWKNASRAMRGTPVRIRVADGGGFLIAHQMCRVGAQATR